MDRINHYISTLLTIFIILNLVFTFESCKGSNGEEKLQNSSKKTVLDFGAVGNGDADDTKAIQRAVNSRIGDVFFPRGTYRITKPIIIELDRIGPTSISGNGTAKIIMAGAGPVFKFIGTHEGTAGPESFKENVWEHQRMPQVDGLEIVGEHLEAVGIEAVKTMQLTLTRLLIRHTLHCIHLTERNRNVIISECHFYQNRGIGVFLDRVNLHQINIHNCHISYNGMGGVVARPGSIRNLQICGCDIEANMDSKGPPTANVLIDISEGDIGEGAIIGCTIQHTPNAPNSANIRFIGRTDNKRRYNVENFTIADNVLADVAVNIDLKNARGVTITGNTIWMGFAIDLLVENSSNIIVAQNIFDRNPSYRYDKTKRMRGLTFRGCTDCLVNANGIQNPVDRKGGLILENCKRFNITNCSLFNCDGSGIFLDNVEFIRISDCMILDNRTEPKEKIAITLMKGKNNMIVDNLLDGKIEAAPQSAHIENNFSSNK
jgi:parallel beta-helix repeat protein